MSFIALVFDPPAVEATRETQFIGSVTATLVWAGDSNVIPIDEVSSLRF